jgi:hypothetical protein
LEPPNVIQANHPATPDEALEPIFE